MNAIKTMEDAPKTAPTQMEPLFVGVKVGMN